MISRMMMTFSGLLIINLFMCMNKNLIFITSRVIHTVFLQSECRDVSVLQWVWGWSRVTRLQNMSTSTNHSSASPARLKLLMPTKVVTVGWIEMCVHTSDWDRTEGRARDEFYRDVAPIWSWPGHTGGSSFVAWLQFCTKQRFMTDISDKTQKFILWLRLNYSLKLFIVPDKALKFLMEDF